MAGMDEHGETDRLGLRRRHRALQGRNGQYCMSLGGLWGAHTEQFGNRPPHSQDHAAVRVVRSWAGSAACRRRGCAKERWLLVDGGRTPGGRQGSQGNVARAGGWVSSTHACKEASKMRRGRRRAGEIRTGGAPDLRISGVAWPAAVSASTRRALSLGRRRAASPPRRRPGVVPTTSRHNPAA